MNAGIDTTLVGTEDTGEREIRETGRVATAGSKPSGPPLEFDI